VSRDFSSPGFFFRQLLDPVDMPRKDFELFRIFVKLSVLIREDPVYWRAVLDSWEPFYRFYEHAFTLKGQSTRKWTVSV
jgi:hypothetical protein